jgi:hypothetical protein
MVTLTSTANIQKSNSTVGFVELARDIGDALERRHKLLFVIHKINLKTDRGNVRYANNY